MDNFCVYSCVGHSENSLEHLMPSTQLHKLQASNTMYCPCCSNSTISWCFEINIYKPSGLDALWNHKTVFLFFGFSEREKGGGGKREERRERLRRKWDSEGRRLRDSQEKGGQRQKECKETKKRQKRGSFHSTLLFSYFTFSLDLGSLFLSEFRITKCQFFICS